MAQVPEPAPVHCYTNPSFCRQSEYIPDDRVNDLPPPPQQFQGSDDLPPPPPPLQLQCHAAGQSNPAFQAPPEATLDVCESRDRYCYLEDNRAPAHRRYSSLPAEEPRVTYNQSTSRYEYIQQDEAERSQLPRRGSTRYDFIPHQQVQQRSAPAANQDDRGGPQTRTCRGNAGRYALIPGDQDYQDDSSQWSNAKSAPRHINTPQGNYNVFRIFLEMKFFPRNSFDKNSFIPSYGVKAINALMSVKIRSCNLQQAVTQECPCKKTFHRHFLREICKNSRYRRKTIWLRRNCTKYYPRLENDPDPRRGHCRRRDNSLSIEPAHRKEERLLLADLQMVRYLLFFYFLSLFRFLLIFVIVFSFLIVHTIINKYCLHYKH